jgi:hypothetical protein
LRRTRSAPDLTGSASTPKPEESLTAAIGEVKRPKEHSIQALAELAAELARGVKGIEESMRGAITPALDSHRSKGSVPLDPEKKTDPAPGAGKGPATPK